MVVHSSYKIRTKKEYTKQRNEICDNLKIKCNPKNQGELSRLKDEIGLLKLLLFGELDGEVGKNYYIAAMFK